MVKIHLNLLASGRFWAGLFVGLLPPPLTFFLLDSIWYLENGGKAGGFAPGAQCYALGRKESLAPNGRFIATSVIIDCEDDNDRSVYACNYVFMSATRLSRRGQVYSSARLVHEPAIISWDSNNTILIAQANTNIEKVKGQWCGIGIVAARIENR